MSLSYPATVFTAQFKDDVVYSSIIPVPYPAHLFEADVLVKLQGLDVVGGHEPDHDLSPCMHEHCLTHFRQESVPHHPRVLNTDMHLH
jgi:hypothetical protein